MGVSSILKLLHIWLTKCETIPSVDDWLVELGWVGLRCPWCPAGFHEFPDICA